MSYDPNSIQYGGDHYTKAKHSQHWDMLPACGFGWEYYIGCATAYMTRIKEPILDAQKALHFIDKLIWLIDNRQMPDQSIPSQQPRVLTEHYLRTMYFPSNNINGDSAQAGIILALMTSTNKEDLVTVQKMLGKFQQSITSAQQYDHQPKGNGNTAAAPAYVYGNDAGATPAYVDQNGTSTSAPPFISGNSGDFAGAGAESSWAEKSSVSTTENTYSGSSDSGSSDSGGSGGSGD